MTEIKKQALEALEFLEEHCWIVDCPAEEVALSSFDTIRHALTTPEQCGVYKMTCNSRERLMRQRDRLLDTVDRLLYKLELAQQNTTAAAITATVDKEVMEALEGFINDLEDRATWMEHMPTRLNNGGWVMPCGNGAYQKARKALYKQPSGSGE